MEGLCRSPRHEKALTTEKMAANVKKVQYAVRGALVLRAYEHEKTLKNNPDKLPFKRITYCNIGNPQSLGQKPITFFRQVIALTEYPALLETSGVEKLFPQDAIDRAKEFLSVGGPTGAYSESQGREHVRKDVAAFINERDGFGPNDSYANPNNIFLFDGASPAVQTSLRILLRDEKDGVMIPIPQYPLYSATIPLMGGSPISYYLDEEKNWALSPKELERAVKEAKEKGITPRGLVIINPGNPTGSILDRENMKDIIRFCHRENILLMADEVYQNNVYVQSKPFVSFKKVLSETPECKNELELLSFHSTSKGLVGECGKRGGYVEMTNIDESVKQEFYKLVSVNLCPNIIGQLMMDLVIRPPAKNGPSRALYEQETTTIYDSLKRRAELVVGKLNSMDGVTCNPSEGAMYALPQIHLPAKAVEEAKKKNLAADAMYCLELLDQTGLCVVPGSGFGQKEGTYHFRTTILPSEEQLTEVMELFSSFHKKFLEKYQ